MQPPPLKSHEFVLAFLPSIGDVPPRRDPGVIQDPLLSQHGDEGHDQRDGKTCEEDGLGSDGTGGDGRDGCQGVGSIKGGVLLQYSKEQDVCQVRGIWLKRWDYLNDERGSDCRE